MTIPARTRVCYASGTWQLLVLCASLRAHIARVPEAADVATIVVFSGADNSLPMRSTLERLAATLGFADRVVWIDDLIEGIKELPNAAFVRRVQEVRERIDGGRVVETWSTNPFFGVDRLLLECYPRARVYLYEDGVLTHARPWSGRGFLRLRLEATLRYWFQRATGDPLARARAFDAQVRLFGSGIPALHASYLVLGDMLGIPRRHSGRAFPVDPAFLRGVLAEVAMEPRSDDPSEHRRALVLGGNFSTWGVISEEDELELYASVVGDLIRAGYRVLWKDHPRVRASFLPGLRERVPDGAIRCFEADHTLPVEVVLRPGEVDLVVSALSSSLLFVPLVTSAGIRTATFASRIRSRLRWPWPLVADLIESQVPDLDPVLAEAAAEPAGAVARARRPA